MSLAFLPAAQISPVFSVLEREAGRFYPATTPPHIRYVHGQQVRTNNDLEGWHFAMTRALPRNHQDIFTFLQWMIDVVKNMTRGVAEQYSNKLLTTAK